MKGISDLITQNGIVNVDFADVKTVMSNMGRALMGTGCAKGEGRARLAAQEAITSPLLDDISVDGATGVLINIVGGPDLKMREIQEAASLVQEQAHEDANIIFGASIDEGLGENVKVTVIATGFDTVERMTALYDYRRRRLKARAGKIEDDGYEDRSYAYQRIVREVLEAQRSAVVALRNDGTISNDVMHRLERELDLEDERLEI